MKNNKEVLITKGSKVYEDNMKMRHFETGAIRSSNKGKNEYYGFRHPVIEKSFADYMRKHQVQEDGNLRTSNNWWGGWGTEISLQSMIRHLEDLTALHSGYKVWKVYDNGEETIYSNEKPKGKVVEVSIEDCLNAIRFNTGAYLLEHLKGLPSNKN